MGFFSGKSLLRVEYVIWIHDIHRICPLKLDLSHRKKIIDVAFDPTKLEAMEVEFFFTPPKKGPDLKSFVILYSKVFKYVHNMFLGPSQHALHVFNIYLLLQRFFVLTRAD